MGHSGNGVISYSELAADADARSIQDVVDGLSKTVLISESREEEWATWYFGHLDFAWEVGYLSPSTGDNPFQGSDGLVASSRASLNVTPYYAGLPAIGVPARKWGPSSEHAGGVVNHLFADGHVISVSENADPSMYLRMITRAGGEQVSEEQLQ